MIVAVIIGYLTRSLREDRYNAFDDMILDIFRMGNKAARKRTAIRTSAFEKFILSLSDQQLITGTAIIIAIYLIRFSIADLDAQISADSFGVAIVLALFSCVIHLSSITLLRNYFDHHKRLRNGRVLLMVLAIGALIPQMMIARTNLAGMTLRCALNYGQVRLFSNGYANLVAASTFIGVIVCSYVRSLLEIYFPRFRESSEVWIAELWASMTSYPSQDKLQQLATRAAEEQLSRASRLLAASKHSFLAFRSLSLSSVASVILFEFRNSFFAEIIWLLFYFTYGICSIMPFIIHESHYSAGFISFSPSFGQILPLVLVSVSLLSAAEAYAS